MKNYLKALEAKIVATYEEGVTMDQAEKLASEFLVAQIKVSQMLKDADLDARLKKSGVKAIRAGIYMETANKTDKKPSDTYIENVVNLDEHVETAQTMFDQADVEQAELSRLYSIYGNAHIHFRSVAKGKFE